MPLATAETLTFLEELRTDGHSPLKFMGQDYEIYYCKYRTGRSLDQNEVDCLFYEVVSSKLLQALRIPTPELALIKIIEGTFNVKDLKYHKKYCRPGVIYLGSKQIPNSDLVQGVAPISSKKEFSQIANPYDLFRIAIFDLWVENCDRGRNENYNILISAAGAKKKFYAFDHAFCFGGLDQLRMFHAGLPGQHGNKLIKTLYFKKFLSYLDKHECKDIVENFLFLQSNETDRIILEAFKDCTREWNLPESLVRRTQSFLANEQRKDSIKQVMLSVVNKM